MGGRFFIVVIPPAFIVLLLLLFLGCTLAYRDISCCLLHGTIVEQLLSAQMLGLQCPQFLGVLSVLFEHLLLS